VTGLNIYTGQNLQNIITSQSVLITKHHYDEHINYEMGESCRRNNTDKKMHTKF
jgi:hypothetical protein